MSKDRKQKKILIGMVFAVVGMFSFSFALVPLYNTFCKITGLNGKTSNVAAVSPVENSVNNFASSSTISSESIDETRWVTVEFTTTNNANLPWDFHPNKNKIRLHPGQVVQTTFYAHNLTDHEMTVQAIPSVSPSNAASHLKKLECFCFRQQKLASHADRDMPLQFYLDKDLPKDVNTVTLSYTLFDLTKKS